jgi:hypothetical protein
VKTSEEEETKYEQDLLKKDAEIRSTKMTDEQRERYNENKRNRHPLVEEKKKIKPTSEKCPIKEDWERLKEQNPDVDFLAWIMTYFPDLLVAAVTDGSCNYTTGTFTLGMEAASASVVVAIMKRACICNCFLLWWIGAACTVTYLSLHTFQTSTYVLPVSTLPTPRTRRVLHSRFCGMLYLSKTMTWSLGARTSVKKLRLDSELRTRSSTMISEIQSEHCPTTRFANS